MRALVNTSKFKIPYSKFDIQLRLFRILVILFKFNQLWLKFQGVRLLKIWDWASGRRL